MTTKSKARRVPGDTKITLNWLLMTETHSAYKIGNEWLPKSQATAEPVIENGAPVHVNIRGGTYPMMAFTLPVWLLRAKGWGGEEFIEKTCIEQGTWSPEEKAA